MGRHKEGNGSEGGQGSGRSLLVVTGQVQPTRRFLRGLERLDPGRTHRLVVATGDAVSFTDRHPRLGAVITLLLGPLDTLLFGNQLVALFGATEQTAEELAVGHLAQAIPAGVTAVITDVDEPDPAVLDKALAGATIARRTYDDVERELGAAGENTAEN